MKRRARGAHPSAWNAQTFLKKMPTPLPTAIIPHCDARVLHAPGQCEYCDRHPEWQEARKLWGINFTGQNDPDKLPCPADQARPPGSTGDHRRWGGNVAHPDRTYEQDLDEQLRKIAEKRA